VEDAATLRLELDDVPFDVSVSWNAPLPATEIAFDVTLKTGQRLRWENVGGSFFHFRSLRGDALLADRETTLREDTLRAFRAGLEEKQAPPIDARVYAVLDAAYGRTA
jgi:hypothetical protein